MNKYFLSGTIIGCLGWLPAAIIFGKEVGVKFIAFGVACFVVWMVEAVWNLYS